ncbi:MAG: beta-lactamase family protein [Alphaproteobacteria bacterium]|nr:beta-lactamase family protein [Alphaproteobacteria bacterium]
MVRRFAAWSRLTVLTLGLVLCLSGGAVAQQRDAASVLAPIFDAYFGEQGGTSYVGAVVVVVQDGEVKLLRGYGYEDVAHTRPIDPESSRFGIASITKTMIAVRIMQLVESGAIASIDDPVANYLMDFTPPLNGGHALTIRDLLTHQGGMYDAALPMSVGPLGPAPDVRAYAAAFPGYIRGAGEGANYSNYGLALLGLVIREVTGKPLQEALADSVFGPLSMTHTGWPSDPERTGLTQTAAFYPNGTMVALPNAVRDNAIVNQGAGGIFATGADMARYMFALLGSDAAPALFSPETRAIMFSRLGETHPLAQGYGTAFMVGDWNGTRLVEHGGRSLGRQSYLTLAPDDNLGVFISVTAEGPSPSRQDMIDGLFGRPSRMTPASDRTLRMPSLFSMRTLYLRALYGSLEPPAGPSISAPTDMSAYIGEYRSQRRVPRSPRLALDLALLGEAVRIERSAEGGLSVNGRPGWITIGPDEFWRAPSAEDASQGYNNLLVFRRDGDGRVADMSFGYTDAVYEKASGLGAPSLWWLSVSVGALAFVTALAGVFWPRGITLKWAIVSVPILCAATGALFFAFWPDGAPDPFGIVLAEWTNFAPYRLAGSLTAICALMTVPAALMSWRRPAAGPGGWWARLHLIILIPAAGALAFSLWRLGATF